MTPMDHYRRLFSSIEPNLLRRESGAALETRRRALERFVEMGFPTTRQEEWRETSLAELSRIEFSSPTRDAPLRSEELANLLLPTGWRMVIVNGRFSSALSRLPDSRVKQVSLKSLAELSGGDPLSTPSPEYLRRPFVALNLAFAEDGVVVRVPDRMHATEPIHLLFVTTFHEEPVACHTRVLIQLGKGSNASVVEHYAGPEGGRYLSNGVTTIEVGGGSSLKHVKLQEESPDSHHISSTEILLGANASITTHSISAGGGLVRNDLRAALRGEGASCEMIGLTLASGRQHVDHHTVIDHAEPHGTSRELYKGVLGGKARGIFNGRILVRPGAQKTDAKQTNRNILLSAEALAHSNPQLEIHADDVKCTHGSTTGQMDEEVLFYLRARGLSPAAARALLLRGFASEISDSIHLEGVRGYIHTLLERWLAAEGSAA